MKPAPEYDFPVTVWREAYEYPRELWPLLDGVYQIILNFSVRLIFVPGLGLTAQLPIRLPEDFSRPATTEEARWVSVATASYAIVPTDDGRSIGRLQLPEGFDEVVLVYASIEEFEIFARELDAIADEMGGPHGSNRLSELSGYRIADFLRARIADANFLSDYEKEMLGRAR